MGRCIIHRQSAGYCHPELQLVMLSGAKDLACQAEVLRSAQHGKASNNKPMPLYANKVERVMILQANVRQARALKGRERMAHYFTREEAESLLPQISIVLLQIQDHSKDMRLKEEELDALHAQAMGNGHHLHVRINKLQKELAELLQTMQELIAKLDIFGCELKDPSIGLIDFLSLRDGREIYLCWHLGEEHINYWHYLDTGYAGRQPL